MRSLSSNATAVRPVRFCGVLTSGRWLRGEPWRCLVPGALQVHTLKVVPKGQNAPSIGRVIEKDRRCRVAACTKRGVGLRWQNSGRAVVGKNPRGWFVAAGHGPSSCTARGSDCAEQTCSKTANPDNRGRLYFAEQANARSQIRCNMAGDHQYRETSVADDAMLV